MSKSLNKRMSECVYRRPFSCALIDMKLGWIHGVTIQECDTCWNKGVGSVESIKYRQEYVQLTVNNALGQIEKLPVSLGGVLIARHAPAEEHKELLARLTAPRPLKLETWAWMKWEGKAWPKRPFIAVWDGLKAVRVSWRRMKKSSCGCHYQTKKAFGWFKGLFYRNAVS